MKLKKLFLKYCSENQLEINKSQLEIVDKLYRYYLENFDQNLIYRIFKKKKGKPGFYLKGGVGVGKTMILNFFFDNIQEKKLRLHFNEFMIKFHDFIFSNKKTDGLYEFVKNLKEETKVLYFDEFQVTNIVDAMILGKLFDKIFQNDIKVIFSSNINIKDLYKEGLQREQFLPFIKILEEKSSEYELSINDDYRENFNTDRFLSPLNQSTNFKFSKFFREVTKNKKHTSKILEIKGRKLELKNFYEGVSKFNFDELFNKNLGSEDYILIAKSCSFIFLENLPVFDENNSDQQQRFITFIDIIYEKKCPLMITSKEDLRSIKPSKSLVDPFKRTVSRLYELTSINFNKL